MIEARTAEPHRRLQPLRSLPLKERVVHELIGLLESGELEPGDRIPTERELSERLAVSRGTIREAVQFLLALGLVETKHGSGTFVADAGGGSRALRSRWVQWTRRNAGRVREILEIRLAVESSAAELAALRVRSGGGIWTAIEGMKDGLSEMAMWAETQDTARLVQADILFHRSLYEGTGNRALVEFGEILAKELVRERAASWSEPGRPREAFAQHQAIYNAVVAGDSAEATAAARSHLQDVMSAIEDNFSSSDTKANEEGERT